MHKFFSLKFLWVFAVLCSITACDGQRDRSLTAIQERGELVVLTVNSPSTYYNGREGLEGYEYDLTQWLGEHLGVEVSYKIYPDVQQVLDAMAQGKGDIVAAGITHTAAREEKFRFGPGYIEVSEQLVCHRDGEHPNNIADLVGIPIIVPAETSYIETLQVFTHDYPELVWEAVDLSTEQILQQINDSGKGCTVVDSIILAIQQRYLNQLVARFNLAKARSLAWVLPQQAEDLENFLQGWFKDLQEQGQLEKLYQHYYGYIPEKFDFVDIRTFKQRIAERLPKYQPSFIEAGKKYNLDWMALAAQAYQESHWNPKAKSPTGVRGIMMLTQSTARRVGVKNRLDPEQSIMGGAKYLADIISRLPEDIPQQQLMWFALAAYNIGMGHLYDARNLADSLGKNSNDWDEMVTVLPLLSQKKYYQKLRYGYARGTEPVIYVQRVRNYFDILHNTL